MSIIITKVIMAIIIINQVFLILTQLGFLIFIHYFIIIIINPMVVKI